MSRNLVLIPVYNEEGRLGGLLERLRQVYAGDVLCVDDGSRDGSAGILRSIEGASTRVISQPENKGYGATILRGFQEAIREEYDFVITMDSDGQHRPDWIPTFFREVESWDVVSGSRYLAETSEDVDAPSDRRAINRLITAAIRDLTSFQITDAFCGFKAYRVSALKKLDLGETGYSMPLEFWIQAKVFGLSVTELPVSRIYDDQRRTFGGDLDDPEKRLAYYRETIERERKKWDL